MTDVRAIVARVLSCLPLMAWGCAPPSDQPLVLATTTSVANSGLLDVVAPALRNQHGYELRSHLVGSGLALAMLANGDADVAITHAPDAEADALRQHPQWRYRKLMFNDFVLVGPPDDPAGVQRAATIEDAMRRIAACTCTFLSRGDRSGTHEREEQLWEAAGARPADGRLVAAGSGMGTTLRIAGETGAYTLTDRATLARYAADLPLAVVFEGGSALLNTYAVAFNPRGRQARAAETFFEWITEGAGRAVIAGYRIDGHQAFTVWPERRPATDPGAVPE